MSFLKLRLAIERAIRVKAYTLTAPINIAIIGEEKDEEITVLINKALVSAHFKEKVPGKFYLRTHYVGCDGFQGSPAELENAFIDIRNSGERAYHLDAPDASAIRYGVFSSLEFQQLHEGASATGSSTTLPSYRSASNKSSNPFDLIPAEKFNYHITELNSLLRALQYYLTMRAVPADMRLSYYPDVSGDLRPTAVIQFSSDRNIEDVSSREFSCFSFAKHITAQYFGVAYADGGGRITGDRQYTLKGTSEQDIHLKLDASDVSMRELRIRLLMFMLPEALNLGTDWVLMLSERYSLPNPPDEICWNLTLANDQVKHLDALLGFLEKGGLKNVTSKVAENKEKPVAPYFSRDTKGLPTHSMEFTVEDPVQSDRLKQIVRINASPETFSALIEQLWKEHAPDVKNSLTY
jgi:hypothetical protein